MIEINTKLGVHVPKSMLPLPEDNGLDIWLSSDINKWICKTLNARVVTIHIKKHNKECVLVLALRKIIPGVCLASSYPYSTILGDVELFWEYFEEAKKTFRRLGISRIELALAGRQKQVVLTEQSKNYVSGSYFKSIDLVRHLVDLNKYESSEKYLSCLEGKLRWSIRKGIKNNISIVECSGENIHIAQQLYAETMRDINAPVNYPADRFRVIYDELKKKSNGNVYLAIQDEKPISMAAVIDSKKTRHLIQVATPKRFRSSRVSDYIVWHLIDEAIQIKKSNFDFMASAKEQNTLIDYKYKWKGEEQRITHAVIVINNISSKLIDLARLVNKKVNAVEFFKRR